ncbi:MAG: peptide deformylase [Elusimicrobiota bacterium]
MNIKLYPDQCLRIENREVKSGEVEEISKKLITEMIKNNGIGLAAPQVGIQKKITAISSEASDNLQKPLILVNPKILEGQGHQEIDEACLSVCGVTARIPRKDDIVVETGIKDNRQVLKAGGLLSIVMQHEIDHLNGILFPDRLKQPKKMWKLLKARYNKWKNERKS